MEEERLNWDRKEQGIKCVYAVHACAHVLLSATLGASVPHKFQDVFRFGLTMMSIDRLRVES